MQNAARQEEHLSTEPTSFFHVIDSFRTFPPACFRSHHRSGTIGCSNVFVSSSRQSARPQLHPRAALGLAPLVQFRTVRVFVFRLPSQNKKRRRVLPEKKVEGLLEQMLSRMKKHTNTNNNDKTTRGASKRGFERCLAMERKVRQEGSWDGHRTHTHLVHAPFVSQFLRSGFGVLALVPDTAKPRCSLGCT